MDLFPSLGGQNNTPKYFKWTSITYYSEHYELGFWGIIFTLLKTRHWLETLHWLKHLYRLGKGEGEGDLLTWYYSHWQLKNHAYAPTPHADKIKVCFLPYVILMYKLNHNWHEKKIDEWDFGGSVERSSNRIELPIDFPHSLLQLVLCSASWNGNTTKFHGPLSDSHTPPCSTTLCAESMKHQ